MSEDTPRYLVIRPNGQDGPYTLADLRALADGGRLQADDRILDAATRNPSSAAQLIPGLVGTDSQARVRRRTSDRLAALPGGPGPKAHRTPLPVPDPQAPAAGPADAHGQPGQEAAKPGRPPRWVIGLLAAAVVFAAVSFASMIYSSTSEPPAPVQPDGRWILGDLPRHGGPWSIEVLPAEVVIRAPDGGTHACGWTLLARDGLRCTIRLERSHPVLGDRLVFATRDGRPVLEMPDGIVPAEHVPAL